MKLEVILQVCAIGGALLGLYNFFAAIVKGAKERKLKASLNLVKAEYRQRTTRHTQLATYLYVVNSDIRPVSDVAVEFFYKDGKALPPEEIPSIAFGAEYCVGSFTHGQRRFAHARFVYRDFDGRMHCYEQADIHENPHRYAVATLNGVPAA